MRVQGKKRQPKKSTVASPVTGLSASEAEADKAMAALILQVCAAIDTFPCPT